MLNASIIAAVKMEAVSTFETSVSYYQTTWHNIPKDSHLEQYGKCMKSLFSFGFDGDN
jgi:hypothetical protein